jgi:hypothetical protein
LRSSEVTSAEPPAGKSSETPRLVEAGTHAMKIERLDFARPKGGQSAFALRSEALVDVFARQIMPLGEVRHRPFNLTDLLQN